MDYKVYFPTLNIEKDFDRTISKIPQRKLRSEIMDRIELLSQDPRPAGHKFFKKLNPPVQFYQLTARYRLRIGNYRVLYDVDDEKRIVWILALRKRSEKTYYN